MAKMRKKPLLVAATGMGMLVLAGCPQTTSGNLLPPPTCTSNTECTTAPQLVCDPQTKFCVQCLTDKDCGQGKVCSNKNCINGSDGGVDGSTTD